MGELVKNEIIADNKFCRRVHDAYLQRVSPNFNPHSLDTTGVEISYCPEVVLSATGREREVLKYFDAEYERRYKPIIENSFSPGLKDITSYYEGYYNKMLPFLIEDFAREAAIPNPEIVGITVAQLFGIAFVLDDIYDGSDMRWGKPAYHIMHGEQKAQEDVNNLMKELGQILEQKFPVEVARFLQEGVGTGVDLFRAAEKQNYTQQNCSTNALDRWFIINKVLFDAFHLLYNKESFDWFTAFSLGTHILNDLVDTQGLIEDTTSSQYNFVLSRFADLGLDEEIIEAVGKPHKRELDLRYQQLVREKEIDRDISAISVQLLEHALEILINKGMGESAYAQWLKARIDRVKSGAYLVGAISGKAKLTSKY